MNACRFLMKFFQSCNWYGFVILGNNNSRCKRMHLEVLLLCQFILAEKEFFYVGNGYINYIRYVNGASGGF